MASDPEIERIKQERLRAMQENAASEAQDEYEAEAKLQQEINVLEGIVKARLTKEALLRYSNIKMAHPEIAMNLLILLARAIQENQLGNAIIDDSQLKMILQKMQGMQQKKDFSIKINK